MDLTNLQEILIAYIPNLTVLLGFLGAAIGFLKAFYKLFKNSNIETIKEEIRNENSEIRKKHDELIKLTNELMTENYDLKKRNNQLLAELTRIADYKEE